MLLAVSAISFALLATAGGDAFTALRDNPQVSDKAIEQLRVSYGLDKPLVTRYFTWFGGFVRGDLGESIQFRLPVTSLVLTRLSNTLLLGGASLFIAWTIALTFCFLCVWTQSPFLRRLTEALILVAASLPRIILSLFALAIFVWLSRNAIQIRSASFLSFAASALVLAVPLIALFLAQAKSELQAAMNEDFVKLARSKGLSEPAVILKHASRAAMNPLLTIFGLSLGGVIGGAVIVETILGWPGIGALTVMAVRSRDVPLVMGIVVLVTAAVWLGNFVGELLQIANDSRLRSDMSE